MALSCPCGYEGEMDHENSKLVCPECEMELEEAIMNNED